MTTINSVGTTLAGQTGTGLFVGSIAPTLTKITFSTTSGVVGTTTNDNAAAGSVGELITSSVGSGTTSLSNGTIADTTSISLTAGDWDIFGNVTFFGGSTTLPTLFKAWVSTTSASDPGSVFYANLFATGTPFATAPISFTVPYIRVSLASPGTVYLSVQAFFTVSTCTSGGSVYARRSR